MGKSRTFDWAMDSPATRCAVFKESTDAVYPGHPWKKHGETQQGAMECEDFAAERCG